jgi:penicillin-binding protein 1A
MLTKRRLAGLFTPVYVALALERGYDLTTPVSADPLTGKHDGGATLFDVVAGGKSLEAARLYTALGGGTVLDFSKRLGFRFDRDDLMMALGYGEATPYEVAAVYASFANGGCAVAPYLIERIVGADGQDAYRAPVQPPCERAFGPQTAYLMRQLFQHAGQRDGFSLDTDAVGGVAAVTDDLHNAWFAGVSPTFTTALWIGSENGRTRLADDEGDATAAVTGLAQDLFSTLPPAYAPPEVDEAPPGVAFKRAPEAVDSEGKPLRLSLPFTVGRRVF